MEKRKVIITGGNGMIGTELVKTLIADYDITVIDKCDDNLKPYQNRINLIKNDINEISSIIKNIDNIYCLIHLAAMVRWIPKTEEEKTLYIKTNIDATEKLFSICINKVKKVLFFSTNDVYSKIDPVINETTLINPSGIYGLSKLEAEKVGYRLFKENGLPLCIFRPSSVFGNNDKGSMNSLISLCRRGVIPFLGEGENIKSLLYLKDIALAVKCYVDSEQKFAGEIFNICSGNYSFVEIVDTVQTVFGYKPFRLHLPKNLIFKISNNINISFLQKLVASGENNTIDFSKSCKILGYIPHYSLKKALFDCVDYYKKI